MSDVLLVERCGATVILTLNRPSVHNALSRRMRQDLCDALGRHDVDPDVHAIILTGAGERAFTAGIDLKEAETNLTTRETRETDPNPATAIEACATPVIAAVNGLCITGGLEIILACDVVFASRAARFADTHVRVGLLPGWGLSQRLSRQIGPQRAKELALSGNFVDADRACFLGLVNDVFETSELMPRTLALAEAIAAAGQDTVLAYKKLIDEGYAQTFADALQFEREVAAKHAASLNPSDIESGRVRAQRLNRRESG